MSVESTTERGIQRFTGTLILHPRPELLEIAVTGEAERIQRREWARVGATVPVRVKALGDGIKTEGADQLAEHQRRRHPDQGHVAHAAGPRRAARDRHRSRRSRPSRRSRASSARSGTEQKGLRFEDLAREDSERLMKFVRERERAALRISRGL